MTITMVLTEDEANALCRAVEQHLVAHFGRDGVAT